MYSVEQEFEKVWRAIRCKQKCLGISAEGKPGSFLNQQGNWIPVEGAGNIYTLDGEQTDAVRTYTLGAAGVLGFNGTLQFLDDPASPSYGFIIGDTTSFGGSASSIFGAGNSGILSFNTVAISGATSVDVQSEEIINLIADDGAGNSSALNLDVTNNNGGLVVSNGIYEWGYYADSANNLSNIYVLNSAGGYDVSTVTATTDSIYGYVLNDKADSGSARSGFDATPTYSRLFWEGDAATFDNGTEIVLDTNGTTVSSLAGGGSVVVTSDNTGLLTAVVGASGSFTAQSGEVVTVTGGIITSIV
jgi:hypothetical protein